MGTSEVVSESRAVSGFDQISLRAQHYNELIITQGDQESLTIEAPKDVLKRIETSVSQGRLMISLGGSFQDRVRDAVSTSLTRPTIKYRVTLKRLTRLEIFSMGRFGIGRLQTERLGLVFRGAGEVVIRDLRAQWLEVDFPGAGKMEIGGQVTEQSVTLSGAGEYNSPKLQSQRARLTINGLGSATVWAEEELDVTIRGAGKVSYYGTPRVRQRIAAIGRLTNLGKP